MLKDDPLDYMAHALWLSRHAQNEVKRKALENSRPGWCRNDHIIGAKSTFFYGRWNR
jgi:hypothetical protein